MIKRVLIGALDVVVMLNGFFIIGGLLLMGLVGLHMEGIISVDPVIVVMNHAIDGALREFFLWLLN